MSNPRPSRAAISAGSRAQAAKAAEDRAYKFTEARHLMRFGVHPETLARQLDTSVSALERLAERWHEDKIAAYMRSAREKPCPTCGETINQASSECRACAVRRRYPSRVSVGVA